MFPMPATILRPPQGVPRALVALGCLASLGLGGCAPGRIAGGYFTNEQAGYRIPVPAAGWVPAPEGGADLVLRRSDGPASIAVATTCGPPAEGPLASLGRHLFFGLRDRAIVARSERSLDGVVALQTTLAATLEGQPVEVSAVVLRRDQCLFDLMYLAAPAIFPRHLPAFEALVAGWRFVRPAGEPAGAAR
jgi:hypothetical protein